MIYTFSACVVNVSELRWKPLITLGRVFFYKDIFDNDFLLVERCVRGVQEEFESGSLRFNLQRDPFARSVVSTVCLAATVW